MADEVYAGCICGQPIHKCGDCFGLLATLEKKMTDGADLLLARELEDRQRVERRANSETMTEKSNGVRLSRE